MPELPEVETICKALRPRLVGREITGVAALIESIRHPLDEHALDERLCGKRIVDVRRVAKYVVVEFADVDALVLHLGMSGSFRVCTVGSPYAPHDRIAWQLSDGMSWRLNDPRRFSIAKPCRLATPGGVPDMLARLGPDPLETAFDGDYLHCSCSGRTQPVKNAIMDQRMVVGIGNIYACEALFLAGISPKRPCGRLSLRSCQRLVDAVRDVLRKALDSGGTTLRNYRSVDGTEGKFALELSVYGREGEMCLRCGTAATVRRIVQAGRSTFYCPRCQH